jgi:DNA-directed RNA polymerase specialized sigma24 family protein
MRVVGYFLPRLLDHFTMRAGDPDIADDVAGHILCRAVLTLHEIRDAQATWVWMCTTGRNYLIDLARSRASAARAEARYGREQVEQIAHYPDGTALIAVEVERVAGSADLRMPAPTRAPDSPPAAVQLSSAPTNGAELDDAVLFADRRVPISAEQYRARLAALSEADRRLLRLIAVDGLSHVEVARVLGIDPAACRKRHSRARRFVREGRKAR